ncbi:DUF6500 family protein [Roseateles sp. PN1]|uniref:DUF6500 family protein n=1 Tax=Roseateles sp. PN1 TaxID=3137372 RepID=UPI00313946FE
MRIATVFSSVRIANPREALRHNSKGNGLIGTLMCQGKFGRRSWSAADTASERLSMRATLRSKILQVCADKIAKKGPGVGLSFYAFFANRNDDPALLMEAATWWIQDMQLDHFEKAEKIFALVAAQATSQS